MPKTVYLDTSIFPHDKAQLSSENTICSASRTPFSTALTPLYASMTMDDFGVGVMGKWHDRMDHQILNPQVLSNLL